MRNSLLDRIVIGYAGDQAGQDGFLLGAGLAALYASSITVVYPYHPLLTRGTSEAVEERIRAEIAALTAGIEGLSSPTYHWSSSSWPIHALHQMAAYEEADLIVFGSAREGLAEHLHMSVMERMVHGAPCAVAVAPSRYADRPRSGFEHIGVGFTDTSEAIAALELARDFAERSGGRVQVVAAAGLEPMLASYAYSSPLLVEVEKEMYAEAKATLDQTIGRLGDRVSVQAEVVIGTPAGVLLEHTGALDLLILGSRAYGPARHALMGSVSARVMREARCPVLVVPRQVSADEPRAGRHAQTAD